MFPKIAEQALQNDNGDKNPLPNQKRAMPYNSVSQGLAKVPLPGRMGTLNPLTHEWITPPSDPKWVELDERSIEGGKCFREFPSSMGTYDCIKMEWIVPPTNPRYVSREPAYVTPKKVPLPKRAGKYNPMTNSWTTMPADSSSAEAWMTGSHIGRGWARPDRSKAFYLPGSHRATTQHLDIKLHIPPPSRGPEIY
ncbi:hypothetical protein CYMTET_21341 [Cymbomonas tetramitiformis]|uniref:Uncharacterized protein n=1 Tax=Cymbomonas tetramitiformis TaxID=36881 RepID=A0AAE0G2D3_9CHLO|nr:hypothetical protein CYMTET_21341 [Cymbomonas tetramitiformis]